MCVCVRARVYYLKWLIFKQLRKVRDFKGQKHTHTHTHAHTLTHSLTHALTLFKQLRKVRDITYRLPLEKYALEQCTAHLKASSNIDGKVPASKP